MRKNCFGPGAARYRGTHMRRFLVTRRTWCLALAVGWSWFERLRES